MRGGKRHIQHAVLHTFCYIWYYEVMNKMNAVRWDGYMEGKGVLLSQIYI